MTLLLIIASLIQFFFGSLVYVRNTFLGRSKPNRMTFLIWAAGGFISAAAAYSAGAGWVALPAFASGIGPFLIFLASFHNPNAYWQLKPSDYVCGFFAIIALILWAVTKDPAVAVFFAILADGLASLPTLVKSWTHPETETGVPFVLALFNSILGVYASGGLVFAKTGFLIYVVIINACIIVGIYNKDPLGKFKREIAR